MRPDGVLVTSSGAKIPQLTAVRAAMARTGVCGTLWAADADPRARSKYFADRFWAMPRLERLTVDDVAEFCLTNRIGTVIPTRDEELKFFARHRDTLREQGVRTMVAHATAVAICIDKLLFAEWGSARGYPVIPTSTHSAGAFGERLVMKERYGSGGRAARIGISQAEVSAAADGFTNPVYQPFIEGVESSVDVYCTEAGDVKACLSRTRDLVVGGEAKVTTTCQDEEIQRLSGAMIRDLGVTYHSVVQLLRDKEGELRIIECNCRFGGASTLAIAAGIDSFAWFFKERENPGLGGLSAEVSRRPLMQVRHEVDRVWEVSSSGG